ncbi:cell wall hydrolase [Phenylobacterium montanum]|uniref:Cell wall hydrolase n=1 Tax=Phenylobacterium montanum TaxID=2823693 RepID=A0A975G070_9CAUL|nr:cell wall hydrolase [Caulobacter sp. S6]QUD88062.1 cell wall hydrolase [Caulobacter sp. S6]
MDDASLLALCAFQEAAGEPDDGVAAIARVVLNRMARRYASDGAIAGTVLAPDQFSWTAFEMVGGRYRRVCHTPAEVAVRADGLLSKAQNFTSQWARVQRIIREVRAGAYVGPEYDRLTDQVVLYLNPRLSQATWANPARHVCDIGRHSFYRA